MTASPGHPSNVRAGFFTRFGFAAIRRLERALSPDAFYQLIALSFRARREDKRPFPPLPLPACLQHEGQQFISVREKRRRDYFNRVLEFLPDQLSSPKWREEPLMICVAPASRGFFSASRRKAVITYLHF
jgi:hypothetical protein